MPRNEVTDPITDQEIAFAHLVLSGAMTDRQAAEAVGLNPDSADYTKSTPRVRAYILEHRAVGQQRPVQQELEAQRPFTLGREQVLERLWQIASLASETTRGSMTSQVKALSIIVAMENFIPNRRVASAEKQPAPPAAEYQVYEAAWLRALKAKTSSTTNDTQPSALIQEEDLPDLSEPNVASAPAAEAAPNPGPSHSTFANHCAPAEAPEPFVPRFTWVPDTIAPFSITKSPSIRLR